MQCGEGTRAAAFQHSSVSPSAHRRPPAPGARCRRPCWRAHSWGGSRRVGRWWAAGSRGCCSAHKTSFACTLVGGLPGCIQACATNLQAAPACAGAKPGSRQLQRAAWRTQTCQGGLPCTTKCTFPALLGSLATLADHQPASPFLLPGLQRVSCAMAPPCSWPPTENPCSCKTWCPCCSVHSTGCRRLSSGWSKCSEVWREPRRGWSRRSQRQALSRQPRASHLGQSGRMSPLAGLGRCPVPPRSWPVWVLGGSRKLGGWGSSQRQQRQVLACRWPGRQRRSSCHQLPSCPRGDQLWAPGLGPTPSSSSSSPLPRARNQVEHNGARALAPMRRPRCRPASGGGGSTRASLPSSAGCLPPKRLQRWARSSMLQRCQQPSSTSGTRQPRSPRPTRSMLSRLVQAPAPGPPLPPLCLPSHHSAPRWRMGPGLRTARAQARRSRRPCGTYWKWWSRAGRPPASQRSGATTASGPSPCGGWVAAGGSACCSVINGFWFWLLQCAGRPWG